MKLTAHDLQFILKQIEIAEAHAAGGELSELVAGYNGNDGLTQAHLLPYGLRTVDGSYNNLLPGRENWGAADQSFPGLFTPTYINDADGDRHDFNPAPNGPGTDGVMGTSDDTGVSWYTNNDYANAGIRSGSQPGPGSGTVIDADPRIISNLIVDQTLDNPAAIAAALTHAGMSAGAILPAVAEIQAAWAIAKPLAPIGSALPSAEYTAAQATLDAKLAQFGVEMDGNSVLLPNVSPDEGLSSPFNGWMTIFGQFFDHGLDLVAKGGNGTVYVPLQPDDPLYSTAPGAQNYIPLTRVTVDAGADGILGTADDGPGPKNLTTPWIDQNQTYASSASKQVFMREYIPGPDGKPIASGLLLEGTNGGLATWADIKAQAKTVLGIELTDLNVGNIPLIATDPYGNFIPGANGYPQLVVGMGPDGQLGTADDVLREGNPAAAVSAQGVVLTGHAFLDDIAHAAVPIVNSSGALVQDGDSALGYANADGTPGPQGQRGPTAYDNELLDRHFIAGDGRVNENIALTAVHQVFHSEHNRLVEHTKDVVLENGDLAFLNEWLLVDVTAMPTTQAEIAALVWDGERLFQAGRFTNEMEYQHLVFEEFGRMMQPDIDVFLFEPSADINPSIAAEFAHVVYRFGHSMLRQDIDVISLDADGKPVQANLKLFDGFLNPIMYDSLGDAEAASGAIIRGMSRQVGSEIDEFVTDVLRNQLLGIPLDLATINIARGRDVGTPPLNEARLRFFNETGDTLLKPYESWADFALNMKNPASIINFIAAYGTHDSVTNSEADPKTVDELRAAATKLVLGDASLTGQEKIDFDNDRLAFLNAEGEYAGGTLGGLNTVDFWMGGLAEKKMAFGGMLGSTFSFVFQMTMENLQDADRFYYLSRTQGLNLLNELENNSFAELVMRNTNLGGDESTALPGNLFSAFEMPTLEMDISKQLGADPESDDPFLGGFSKLVERRDANGDGVAEYIRINSNEHFTIGGTENNDIIVSGGGDDAIWGKGGDDTIEAGYGVDKVFGGEGDDIITNAGTDIGESDFLHGNEGNDVIHGGSGLSLIFGNQGDDFLVAGPDGKTLFGGTGDDFILGGTGLDVLHGNEGNDWIEGGDRFDTLAGENSELFFNSTIIGHDVLNGGRGDTDYDAESGDDIMFVSVEGIQRMNGMAGFDWATHKGDSQGANSNLGIPIFESQEAFILRDRFDLVEGLSGWDHNDNLTGRITSTNSRAELQNTAAIPGPDSPLDSYSNDLLEKNVDLILGLRTLVSHLARETVTVAGKTEQIVMKTADASDILLGGGGSDVITGLAGNDIIDGDNWLNVRIQIHQNRDGTGPVIGTADGMAGKVFALADYVNGAPRDGAVPLFSGRPLTDLMFDRTINPGQLEIVREIVDGDDENTATDTAVYRDVLANYRFTQNADGSLTVTHVLPVDPADAPDPVDPDSDDEEDGEPGENEQENETEGGEHNPDWDGVDRLFNIEKLRFSDGNGGTVEYFINQLPIAASGAPIIVDPTPTNGMVSPTEGQQLSISRTNNVPNGIVDSNGLPTAANRYAYQWQVSDDGGATWTNVSGATSATYTPGEGLLGFFGTAGSILRVRVSFTDNAGHPEVLYSAATQVVGDNWDAVPFLSNTFNGTAGDDVADGTSGLFGAGANDMLNGNGGNDILNGAGGTDTLNGGAGNDRLDGGAGNDTAVYAGGVGDFALGSSGTNLVVTDLTGAEGTDMLSTIETLRFAGANYTVVAGTTGNNANLNGANGAAGPQAVFGHAGTDSLNGGAANDLLVGGQGADTVNGGTGNDTIYWTSGDGRDFMDGGADTDTVKLVGDASAETYRIYARAEALAAGITGLNANTEIVITRNGTNNASIIAELDNVEEIAINGMGGGDTFIPIGSFAGTSLLTSTITLHGSAADDTVDISALQSAHRIVFRSSGGNDTIVGTLRPQDTIELPAGSDPADYSRSYNAQTGMSVLSNGEQQIVYSGDFIPTVAVATSNYEHDDEDDDDSQTSGDDDHDDDDRDEDDNSSDDGDDDDRDACGCDDDDTVTPPPVTPGAGGALRTGTAQADVLLGTAGADSIIGLGDDDVLIGEGGDDVISAGDGRDFADTGAGHDIMFLGAGDDQGFGGAGADALYGEAGDDRLFGGAGKDRLDGGIGNDTVVGGGGDDLIVASIGDGNDIYYGDDLGGGSGVDTLDMSAITAAATVDLGNGLLGRGSSSSAQTGLDTLWGVENVATGSGDDRITASDAGNVMEGGAGNDTFRFLSAQGADGDTILDFEPGDRLDLSAIDADTSVAGGQVFTIVSGSAFTASAQLLVSFETRADGDYTVVKGNVGGDADADFELSLKGTHTLTSGNVIL